MGKATRFLKRSLQPRADSLIASSRVFTEKFISAPHLSGKFSPYKPDQDFYAILKPASEDQGQDGCPVPPGYLREYVSFGITPELFLSSGEEHVGIMERILRSANCPIDSAKCILDFGCAAGRMIRWLRDCGERSEFWGADIQAEHILWCQQHLSPPFKFVTVTTAPHLPFEDRYFDLIYCGSVFTHIDDLADAWLLELKRILQPGGMLYITVHDKHSLAVYKTYDPADWSFVSVLRSYEEKENISNLDFNMLTIGRGHISQVFYDIDYLKQHWGHILEVVSVTQDAYGGQTAILLKK